MAVVGAGSRRERARPSPGGTDGWSRRGGRRAPPTAKRNAAKQAGLVDEATRRAAEARLARRLGEAVELLSPSGITATPRDPGQPTAALAAPLSPPPLSPPARRLP